MNLEYAILGCVAAVILALVAMFIFGFGRHAIQQRKRIDLAINGLAELQRAAKAQDAEVVDMVAVRSAIDHDVRLSHLWDEFQDTLHEQPSSEVDQDGQPLPGRFRQTMPAESYFSSLTLVEVPLKTEFYKHLPGILTGLGIIGTFAGLIMGLSAFDLSFGGPEVGADQAVSDISKSVGGLLESVTHAFIVSAVAIGLAMLVTFVEKRSVASLIGRVEKLCEIIDEMFDAGAGEEYLASLVESAQISATQTRQLKDALVADLRELLDEITSRQIEAMSENARAQVEATQQSADVIARQVAGQIDDTLRVPLEQISQAVGQAHEDQGAAVAKLLTNAVAQLESLFGDQITGMSTLLHETNAGMQETLARIGSMVDDIGGAGKRAADEMAERLDASLDAFSRRQGELNQTMREFVDELRRTLIDQQAETSDSVRELVKTLQSNVTDALSSMQREATGLQQAAASHQRELHDDAKASLDRLSEQVSQLVASSSDVTRGMAEAIAGLSTGTSGVVEQLDSSTRRLASTISQIAGAGENLSDALRGADELARTLGGATTNVTQALESARSSVEQHRQSNLATSQLLEHAQTVIEAAKSEAGLTSDIVASLTDAAGALTGAQREVEAYVPQLTGAMQEAHSEFATQLRNSLQIGNQKFHEELVNSVGLLGGAVKDLEDVVSTLADAAATTRD